MRFPFLPPTAGPSSGPGPYVWYSASGGLTVIAPTTGMVAPIRRDGSNWALAFYPGSTFAGTHRVANDWTAVVPNVFVFESSAFTGSAALRELVGRIAARGRLIALRRVDGAFRSESLFDVSEPMEPQIERFLGHWWDGTGVTATSLDFVLGVSVGGELLRADDAVGLAAFQAADATALVTPSAGHERYALDVTEYLHRLADGGLLEDAEQTSVGVRSGAAQAEAFARPFSVTVANGATTSGITLRGGLQDVTIALPQGEIHVPENIMIVGPAIRASDTSEEARSEDNLIVLDGSYPSGSPIDWELEREGGSTTRLATATRIQITWGQISAPDRILPFDRLLVAGTAAILFKAVKNPFATLRHQIDQIHYCLAQELAALDQTIPGHTRTTYGHVEELRQVVRALQRMDRDGSHNFGSAFVDRPVHPAILESRRTRRRIAGELRTLFEAGWLISFCETSGDVANEVLIDLPLILSTFPQGREALHALNTTLTPRFIASRIAKGLSGLRAGLGFFSHFLLAGSESYTSRTASFTEAVRWIQRQTDQFFAPYLWFGSERVPGARPRPPGWPSLGFGEESDRLEVAAPPEFARELRNATRVLEGVLNGLLFVGAVREQFESPHPMSLSNIVHSSRYGAKFLASMIEVGGTWYAQQRGASLERYTWTAVRDLPRLSTSRALFAVRGFAAFLQVIASVIEISELLPRLAGFVEEGDNESAFFCGVAIAGALLAGIGAVAALEVPPVGGMISFASAILSLIGYLGMAVVAAGGPPSRLEEFLWTLRHCYFGTAYADSGNWLRDDVPMQISMIYSFFFPLYGAYFRSGGDLYLELDTSSFDRVVDARVSFTFLDRSRVPVGTPVGFTLNETLLGRVLASNPHVAVELPTPVALDAHTIRVRIRGEAVGAALVDSVDSVIAMVSLVSYGPPPGLGTDLEAEWDSLFGDDNAYATRKRIPRFEQRLPSTFDALVEVFP